MSQASRTVSSTWHGDFRCRVQSGDFTIDVDEPVSVGGSNTGPQPTEVFLASIASCFTLAVSYAAKKRDIDLDHLTVDVTGIYDGPKFSAIEITVDAGCPPTERERLIKAAERVCYVTNTLRTTPPISIRSAEAGQ